MLRIFRHYISGVAFLLFLGDIGVILAAFYVTEISAPWAGSASLVARFIEVATVITFVLYLGDLYQPRRGYGRREMMAHLLICHSAAALVIATVGFAVPPLRLSRSAFLGIFLLTTPGLMIWRAALFGRWSQHQLTVRVLVLGTGQVGHLISQLEPTSARPFQIIGFLDDAPGASEIGVDAATQIQRGHRSARARGQ